MSGGGAGAGTGGSGLAQPHNTMAIKTKTIKESHFIAVPHTLSNCALHSIRGDDLVPREKLQSLAIEQNASLCNGIGSTIYYLVLEFRYAITSYLKKLLSNSLPEGFWIFYGLPIHLIIEITDLVLALSHKLHPLPALI